MKKESKFQAPKNWCKPHIKEDIDLAGFSAETADPGEMVKVLVSSSLTSFDPFFHKLTQNIFGSLKIDKIDSLLVIIDKEKKANIYQNNFPIAAETLAKRKLKAGEKVFASDIAGIRKISFQFEEFDLNPKDGEKIVWLFRKDFIFGLYFDLSGNLKTDKSKREMGRLYQTVIYHDLYLALEGQIEPLFSEGWFPFISLIGRDHDQLFSLLKEGKLDRLDRWSETAFPIERIKVLTEGWFDNEFFKLKESTISQGLENFYGGKYIAAISTLTPMVEGLVNEAELKRNGKFISSKAKGISEGLIKLAGEKLDWDSLTFPGLFKKYLMKHYFQNTHPEENKEATRHPVTHGRAKEESYTRERALQIILTLDQIRFYL